MGLSIGGRQVYFCTMKNLSLLKNERLLAKTGNYDLLEDMPHRLF